MGFENLEQAVDQSVALAPITPETAKFSDEQLDDAAAVGLVINDASLAERFVNSKALPQEWDSIDNAYRAVVAPQKWPGSEKLRAHLGMPLILEVIESMLPQIFLGFFSDKQPFSLTGKGTTTAKSARAIAKVVQWAIKKSGFKEEIRKALKSCLQYGMGIGKYGWKHDIDRRKKYSKDEAGNVVSETEEVDCSTPTFEFIDLRNILVDSALRNHDIRNAKFVIIQKFVTANDLDELRDDPTYKNVPSREQLKMILATKSEPGVDSIAGTKVSTFRQNQAERQDMETSVDPMEQPLEILERWTEDRVIVTLQRKICLRNDENEFDELPFRSCAFVDVLNAFFGLGIGSLLKGEQSLQVGVVNKWLDSLDLTLSPSFHRKKGVGPSAQNIGVSPGKVVNDDGELAPLQVQSVTAEALQAIQISESRGRRRVGANFGPDMPTQAMRTAEGVNEFTAGIQVRTQYFIELFAEMVYVPTLEAFISVCKDNLSPKQIDEILTEEEGQAFDDDHLAIYNGSYSVEVLSSTKLASKRAMVSLVPTLMQLFSAAPIQNGLVVQGKKLDMAEFMEQVIDLAGWDSPGLIVPMTPDDMNRAMSMNPAVQRTQGDLMLQNAKHKDDMELESAKGDVRGGIQVVKHVLDQSAAHDERQAETQPPSFWPYGGKPAEPLATRQATK
jgi:hypothetical protein